MPVPAVHHILEAYFGECYTDQIVMPFFLLRPALTGRLAVDKFLTDEESRSIIEDGERGLDLVAGETEDRRDTLRKSEIAWLSPEGEHRWLFQRIGDCINDVNRNWFRYNLIAFEGIQFTKYSHDKGKSGDFYSAHKDTGLNQFLSFLYDS